MNKSLLKITKSVLMTILLMNAIPTLSHAGSWNGWIYQDPYPTSNTLLAVKFITPKKGWVAGELGTILYTEDGGESWEAQESGTEQDLLNIAFVNEKAGWAVGNRGIIIHTEDRGKTWATQTQTKSVLKSIIFINEKEGWTVGGTGEKTEKGTVIKGVVLHTTDGGKTWKTIDTGINHAMVSVCFINPQTGWILGEDKIYRTKDGGKNWEKSTLPKDEFPVFGAPGAGSLPPMTGWDRGETTFTDEKNGWAVIGFGLIFHSADGGKTWKNQLRTGAMSYGLSHVSFIDPKRGCAGGSSLLCTEDGGKTWNEKLGVPAGSGKRIDHFLVQIQGISFPSQSIGWAVGNEGQIWKSEDGSRTWTLAARRDECGGKTFFVNKKTGWFFGNNSTFICRTNDGSHSREKQEVGFNVWDVFFTDNTTGWVVGKLKEGKDQENPDKIYGVIKRTTDGGKTWTTQFKELMGKERTEDGLYRVFFINHNIGWAVGYKGTIVHTEDGGKIWRYQKKETPELYLGGVWFIDSKVGWVSGYKLSHGWTGIILHSEDGGTDWQTQLTKESIAFEEILFLDNKSGWVIGETPSPPDFVGDCLVLHTKDGGKTWAEKIFYGIGGSLVAFLDKNHGVLSLDTGFIIITTDGGKTWEKMRKPIHKYPWHFSELFEAENKGK